ncbi:hypothetical protein DWB84_01720 [Saccharophagus sp. K07]|jgi:hypothetical protein|uniref:hypothetical protein n=1 Tax=Saccharophagus sp. K07 TaxID=2283636 RepID=UPI001651D51E|nr:hypothetical protein [Saccharophagus sp. K07]MBC6904190.1 hypothetical protein [Saccharophagus sp. K07]
MASRDKLCRLFDAAVKNSGFGAFLVLSGVILGAISSLYATEIKDGSEYTLYFCIACAAFLVMWTLRDWRLNVERIQHNQKLNLAQQQLMETVRTMPPQNMLGAYGKAYRFLSEHFHNLQESTENDPQIALEKVEEAIRLSLSALCSIISAFENYPTHTVYSANIMLYRKSRDLLAEPELKDAVLRRLKFVDVRSLDGLAGVLDLELKLSFSSLNEDEETTYPDARLEPIALPIPELDASLPGRTRYIPGAPTAFRDEPCLIPDSRDMARIVEENCDVSPSVVRAVETYFHEQANKGLNSWLSVRINDRIPERGILNIHCNRPDILVDEKQVYTYVNLIIPFKEMIDQLLTRRQALMVQIAGG